MANGHGGPRPGAGRKPNSKNKATVEREKAISESGLTPLEYMLSVLRDDAADEAARMEAAKAAAPYVHPRLQATELNAKVQLSYEEMLRQLG